jgi:hypothetical protein
MDLIVESGLNGSLAMHVSNHCHDSLDEEGFHVSLGSHLPLSFKVNLFD